MLEKISFFNKTIFSLLVLFFIHIIFVSFGEIAATEFLDEEKMEEADDNKIMREYVSPNKINKLCYKGSNRFGYGSFYKENIEFGNELLTVKVEAVEPKVKWHGDDIAEIYIYGGPGAFYSYVYLFEYNLITPKIFYIVDILPEENLVINTNDITSLDISTLVPYKLVQKIKIDGLYGNVLIYNSKNKTFQFKIDTSSITVLSKVEPWTYKELEGTLQFVFKREF